MQRDHCTERRHRPVGWAPPAPDAPRVRCTQRCGRHRLAKHRQRAAPATAGELSHHHLWVCRPRPPVALGPLLGLSVPVCIRAAARSERAGVRGAAGRAVATDPALAAVTPRARQGDPMRPLHQPHALAAPTPRTRQGDTVRQPRAPTKATPCVHRTDHVCSPRRPHAPTKATQCAYLAHPTYVPSTRRAHPVCRLRAPAKATPCVHRTDRVRSPRRPPAPGRLPFTPGPTQGPPRAHGAAGAQGRSEHTGRGRREIS